MNWWMTQRLPKPPRDLHAHLSAPPHHLKASQDFPGVTSTTYSHAPPPQYHAADASHAASQHHHHHQHQHQQKKPQFY